MGTMPDTPTSPSISLTTDTLTPSTTPSRDLECPDAARSSRSTSSARGSEARLAAIITAMNDIDLTSHYVVVRGIKPGVYSNWFVSACFFYSC